MIELLFTFVYWYALLLAAVGVLVVGAMCWFRLIDWLARLGGDRRHIRAPKPIGPPLRPFDQNDPLEQALALPPAADPRWLV